MAATRARHSGSKALARKALLALTRKRLERFVGMVPRFLVNDEPKLIHDLRVRSRRLQQTLRVVLPRPRPRSARKIVKVLRDVRQSLGPCRNLDVNLALARQRGAEAPTPAARDAWSALAGELAGERQSLLDDARRRIARHDLPSFIERMQAALASVDITADPLGDMKRSLREALAEWDDTYAVADKNRGMEELHALRIAGKRLRYRAELLADAGVASIKPMTRHLQQMQATLGDWHDGSMLIQRSAEFLRRPKFVEHRPDLAGALLEQMEEEQKRAGVLVDGFFAAAPQMRKSWRPTDSKKTRAGKPEIQ